MRRTVPYPKYEIEMYFDFERRSNGMSEPWALDQGEGYGVCSDEVKLERAQGECLGIRSR